MKSHTDSEMLRISKNARQKNENELQMLELAKKGIGYRKGKTAALLKELLSLS